MMKIKQMLKKFCDEWLVFIIYSSFYLYLTYVLINLKSNSFPGFIIGSLWMITYTYHRRYRNVLRSIEFYESIIKIQIDKLYKNSDDKACYQQNSIDNKLLNTE